MSATASDLSAPPRRRQRRGTSHAPPAARRGQIAMAAVACFAESGYERTTMDMVAARAGLSKGSVYRFFASKDALLMAVCEMYEAAVMEALAGGDGEPVLARFDRAGRTAVELLRSGGDLGRTWLEFLAHPEGRERMRGLYRDARRELTAVVEQGIRRGELREGRAADIAVAVLGLLEGVLLQAIIDSDFDAARSWPGAWKAFSQGLTRSAP